MNTMNPTSHCRWCGMLHGPMCSMVKSIEFHADGITVKRVEFKSAGDYGSVGLAVNNSTKLHDGQATTSGRRICDHEAS